MKANLSLMLSAFTLIFAMHTQAATPTEKREVVIALNDVYVPGGFDSMADAYVVASGIFPNSCYVWKGATQKDVSAFEHEITTTAEVNQGVTCLMVLVPFSKDIRLGKLPAGTHTLRFLSGDGTNLEKTLVIE